MDRRSAAGRSSAGRLSPRRCAPSMRRRRPQDGELGGPARMRLAYDEYLAGQLALLIVRSSLVAARGMAAPPSPARSPARVEAALPFALTDGPAAGRSPRSAADLAAPDRMSRLLQGDVGAGKTVVALMAMAAMAEGGAQSALMAPTELLAAQHFRTLQPLCEQRRPGHRPSHRQDAGGRAARHSRRSRLGRDRHRRRHACPVPVRCRVPQSRPCRRRRAAPVRRPPAPGALATRAGTPTCW